MKLQAWSLALILGMRRLPDLQPPLCNLWLWGVRCGQWLGCPSDLSTWSDPLSIAASLRHTCSWCTVPSTLASPMNSTPLEGHLPHLHPLMPTYLRVSFTLPQSGISNPHPWAGFHSLHCLGITPRSVLGVAQSTSRTWPLSPKLHNSGLEQ